MRSYLALADIVLVLHFGVVLFIIGGLALIVAGNTWHWRWVNNIWFRLAHIAAITIVAVQTLLGQLCPLTTLESWLRSKAGSVPYSKSFIEYWIQRALFYEAPLWIFAMAYTVFGLLVVAAWWRFPPRRTGRREGRAD
jgi:hypothetical protein